MEPIVKSPLFNQGIASHAGAPKSITSAWLRRTSACCIGAIACGLAPTDVSAQQRESDEVVYQETFNVTGVRTKAPDLSRTTLELGRDLQDSGRIWNQLAAGIPNLHVGSGGAGSFGDTFGIRGLANTPYFGDPAVTVYLDDIPLGSSFTYPTSLASFARAEVHKGPQGTAFGRAGTGGVIVLLSQAPQSAAESELGLSVGDYGSRAAILSAVSALHAGGDAVLSLWHTEQSGFVANSRLGIRVDPTDEYGGHMKVRFRPDERSEISLQVLAQRSRNGAQPFVPLGGPYHTVERDHEGRTEIDSASLALKAALDLSWGHLTAVTAYSDWRLDPFESHIVLPPGLDSRVVQDQTTWSEEIRLASSPKATVGWNAGLWLSRSETGGDVFRALTGLFPIEASGFSLVSRTAAAFGQVSGKMGPRWTATGGLRAERIAKQFSRWETIPSVGHFDGSGDFENITASLALDYSISDGAVARFSVGTGVKPGGYSAFTGNRALAPFKAEHVLAIEGGIHAAPTDGTLVVDASAFAYFIRDFQIERSFTATDYLVVNAPRARSLGGELSADWRPADGWSVRGALGLTWLTLREFRDSFSGVVYDGNRAPYAPEYSANFQISYHDSSGWFGSCGTTLTGRTFFDESENPLFTQDSHALFEARAGYAAGTWQLALYGQNLTDAEYYAFINPGVMQGIPGAPRTFGAEFSIKF